MALDWEPTAVVPFQHRNPPRAFLWTEQTGEVGTLKKAQLFIEQCKKRGVSLRNDAAFASSLQEAMQNVADFVRVMVEVTPWDQCMDLEPSKG